MKVIKAYSLLIFATLIFSLASIFSKLASTQSFFSKTFILYYVCILIILALYAFIWQKILKGFPLTTAYVFRALLIVWGVLWGYLFFNEMLTLKMVIGVSSILFGLYWYVKNE